MNIIGNDIYITRGESFTLDFDIVNKDGSPFIIHDDFETLYLVFSLKSNLYAQADRYENVYLIDLSDNVKFKNTQFVEVTDLSRYPPNALTYEDDFINDATGRIAVFKMGDEYFYYDIESQTYQPYNLQIIFSLSTDDTLNLTSQNYYYSIKLMSCNLTNAEIVDSYNEKYKTNYTFNELTKEQINFFLNRLIIDGDDLMRKLRTDYVLIDNAKFIVND